MRIICIAILAISFIVSCKPKVCRDAPDTSGIELEVTIERFDLKLGSVQNRDELELLLKKNPVLAYEYLSLADYPDPSIPINHFYDRITHPSFDTLMQEVQSEFGDMADIQQQLAKAFKIIKYYYPNFQVPRIQTTVTGFIKDNYLSDSLIILGLDYYLGPGATFRPELPEYILKRYQKEYMVPQLMVVHFSRLFNQSNLNDQTILADMIFYGKAYAFGSSVMPCTPDSLFTGYTTLEMEEIYDHEQVIWAGVLENELLFHTNHEEKNKIFSERPKTIELGDNCPGRIGRWIGWRIVDQYMGNNPETTLKQLMAKKDANAFFNDSGYKPIRY